MNPWYDFNLIFLADSLAGMLIAATMIGFFVFLEMKYEERSKKSK